MMFPSNIVFLVPYFWYVSLDNLSSMEDNGIKAGKVCISVFGSIAGITLAVMFEVRSPTTAKSEILAAVEIIPVKNSLQVMVYFFTYGRQFLHGN